MHCKNKCKLAPKEVTAKLPPFWSRLTLTSILKQLGANIYTVINVKHLYMHLLLLLVWFDSLRPSQHFFRRDGTSWV